MSGRGDLPTHFVYIPELLRQAKAVETWVKRENRKLGRTNIWLLSYAVLVTVLLGLAVGALNYAVPMIRFIPVFFYARADGGTEFALTSESMPNELVDAVAQSALWQYVMRREGYSWVEADYNHYVVMAMSDHKTGEMYDAWFTGQNPDSYLRRYGKNTKINVGLVEVTEHIQATPYAPGKITIHYDRFVYTDGTQVQKNLWSVTLTYVKDYHGPGMKIKDILQFNPLRVFVTGYSAPIDLAKDAAK